MQSHPSQLLLQQTQLSRFAILGLDLFDLNRIDPYISLEFFQLQTPFRIVH